MKYKIFILTIERNSYRLSCIKEKLNQYNINYEIFYGVDYKNFSKKKLKKFSSNGYGKLCPYPTLACALSHLLLWNHISNDKTIDYAIILEDDTYLTNKIYNYIHFINKNIKNTIVCTLCLRHALERKIGRIKSIDAPVVPIHEANKAPMNNMIVFTIGEPFKVPRTKMPPDIVKSAQSKIINGI